MAQANPRSEPLPPPEEDEDDHECKCPPKGAPAWMATFADMATLLMAFFVLILSFADFDEVSFKKMTGALREHFGSRLIEIMPNPESTTILEMDFRPSSEPPSPKDSPERRSGEAEPGTPQSQQEREVQEFLDALGEALENGEVQVERKDGKARIVVQGEALPSDASGPLLDLAQEASQSAGAGAAPQPDRTGGSSEGDGGGDGEAAARRAAIAEARLRVALREETGQGLVDVEQREGQVFVTVGAGGAFGSGSAELTDEARAIMSKLALASATESSRITVTGHTDSVPLTGTAYVDNWGLAAARASAVVRALGDSGLVEPGRMTAVSRGETEPVASNDTPEGRARNRRIEIEIDYADD